MPFISYAEKDMDSNTEKPTPSVKSAEIAGDEVNHLENFRRMLAGETTPEELAEIYQTRERKLRELAFLDPLTGLLNRRGLAYEFNRKLPVVKREIKDGEKSGFKSCYAMLDVDDLTAVNDRFGHEAGGDSLLSYIGQTLSTLLRSTDLAARVGGDEFAVILDNISIEEALKVTERWRTVLTKNEGTFLPQEVHAAVSIGIVELPKNVGLQDFDDKEFGNKLLHQAYKQADAMLYQAKRSGKGQTVIFPTSVHK